MWPITRGSGDRAGPLSTHREDCDLFWAVERASGAGCAQEVHRGTVARVGWRRGSCGRRVRRSSGPLMNIRSTIRHVFSGAGPGHASEAFQSGEHQRPEQFEEPELEHGVHRRRTHVINGERVAAGRDERFCVGDAAGLTDAPDPGPSDPTGPAPLRDDHCRLVGALGEGDHGRVEATGQQRDSVPLEDADQAAQHPVKIGGGRSPCGSKMKTRSAMHTPTSARLRAVIWLPKSPAHSTQCGWATPTPLAPTPPLAL